MASASMISFRICRPSHIERVARSHSAITSSSPGAKLSRAFLSCGRPARLLPDAVSLKISPQRSAFSALIWRSRCDDWLDRTEQIGKELTRSYGEDWQDRRELVRFTV